MFEMTASELREMWAHREEWLGITDAADHATPMDCMGWALSRAGDDNVAYAMAFFDEAVKSGVVGRMFSSVVTHEWVEAVRQGLQEMWLKGKKMPISEEPFMHFTFH